MSMDKSTQPPLGNGRAQWIDSAKGLGILLIVIGHVYSTITPSILYVYIYAFHVPLFFFISGVTLRPGAGPFASVVAKKVRTLIVPYLWYSMLGYMFYVAGYFLAQHRGIHIQQFDYGLWPPLAGIFYGTIGDGRLINGPLWFVMALFWTFLIGYSINTFIRQSVWQWVAVAVFSGIGLWLAGRVALPFSGIPALSALVFFQAGYRIRFDKWSGALGKHGHWLLLSTLLLISAFSPINGFIQFGEGLVGNPWWFMLFAFSGLLSVVVVLRHFEGQTGWLAVIGRYSLSIMLIHMLLIKAVKVVLAMMLQTSMGAIDNDVALGLLVLALTAVMLIPAVYVMEHYLPFTLGKSSVQPRSQMARS